MTVGVATFLMLIRPFFYRSRDWRKIPLMLAVLGFSATSPAQTVALAPVFVTASRGPAPVDAVAFSHQTISGDEVRQTANVTLDGALRAVPEFSLFRRTDSLVANPTSQGVSLRGLGPSGASRSLVLLDGIPLNDPFGGWVPWSELPRESLAGIELVPGGGSSAWGNAALGGVLQLFTEPVAGSRERLVVKGGSFQTRELEGQVTEPVGAGTLQLLGRDFSTAGFRVVAPERRGPIDTAASSRSNALTARWRQSVSQDIDVTLTVRRFEERRANGTPYQKNNTDQSFASVNIGTHGNAFRWDATAYVQSQNFSSTFSSVNAARDAETPASNQFAVPATALGLGWVGAWRTNETNTSIGWDVRDVRGETREDSGWVGTAFTRRRFAGGRQTTSGIFFTHDRPLVTGLRGNIGLRLDDWRDSDGHRRDLLNGIVTNDSAFPHHDGVEASPSAGVVWRPGEHWDIHASAQEAFRRPTLNELYRPFRVGNVITEANPNLRTETVLSEEIGTHVTAGPFGFGATFFRNDLRDAVANVTVGRGPGVVPDVGFVPAGGEGRRRLNLDRVRVQGASLSAEWRVASNVSLSGAYLFDDSEVRRATVARGLEGLRLAQVPRESATLGLSWKPGRWTFSPRVRFLGAQFEDDLNRLRLGATTLVEAFASVRLKHNAELFLSGENIFNQRVETGRSDDGVVSVGTPRMVLAGLRLSR
jgi:outer membrane receptor protein involved in Fe transport